MKKDQKFGKPFAIGMGLVIAFLLLACLFIGLAFSDPNVGVVQTEVQADTVIIKLAQAAFTSKPAQLTSAEASMLFEKSMVTKFQSDRFRVTGVQCEAQTDGSVLFYMLATVRGRKVSVMAQARIGYENEKLFAEFTAVRVGRLPINPQWAVAWVKNSLPPEAEAQGKIIRVKPLAQNIQVLNSTVFLQINSLQVTESGFLVGVKADTKELEEQLKKKLDGINRLFG